MINPYTGEVLDLTNNQDLLEAYRLTKQLTLQAKKMKDEVQKAMAERTKDTTTCELTPQFIVKKQLVEVSNYPISVLRQYFDEDTFSLLVKPIIKNVQDQSKQLSKEDRQAFEASKIIERSHYIYKITEI
jgi:hypothetical protein